MVAIISSDRKTIYQVTQSSCTCADFMYRQARINGRCKHMIKCFGEIIDTTTNDIDKLSKLFKPNGLDFDKAYDLIGDEKVKQMIDAHIICKSPIKGDFRFILLE